MNAMRKIIGWLFASGVHKGRTIQAGVGLIEIDMPEVRDLPEGAERFHSKILEAYGGGTETLDEIICVTRIFYPIYF